jgi:hypothetical protein
MFLMKMPEVIISAIDRRAGALDQNVSDALSTLALSSTDP